MIKLSYYLKLFRAYLIARQFRAQYEHAKRDVKYHPQLPPALDVYSPATGTDHPVLIFVHGGGWSNYARRSSLQWL